MITNSNPQHEIRFSRRDRQYARDCSKLLEELSGTLLVWERSCSTFPQIVDDIRCKVVDVHTYLARFTDMATQNPPKGIENRPEPNGKGVSLAFTGKF